MGYETKNGYKANVFSAARGSAVTSGDTTANTWYEVLSRGSSSTLPARILEGGVFKSPDTGSSQITLAEGDSVYPLTLTEICKTDATIEGEEGTIEVTDDCESGYTSYILDGYVDLKGSLGGFLKLDDSTGVIKDDSLNFLKRFLDYVTDDGEGNYVFTAKANEKLLLMICLNKDAVATEKQNWLIVPVQITTLGTGAALKDAQKRDLSWVKAQGPASLYARTAFTADVI